MIMITATTMPMITITTHHHGQSAVSPALAPALAPMRVTVDLERAILAKNDGSPSAIAPGSTDARFSPSIW